MFSTAFTCWWNIGIFLTKQRMVYCCCYWYHKVPKFETNISRNETARPRSQFLHSCIWERFLNSHYQSLLESLFTFEAKKKLTTRINCFHLLSVIFQIRNLYVGHLCELSAQPQEQWGGQGTAANHYLVAVPCPSLCSCSWAESSLTQNSNIEIPNKTFTGPSFAVQSSI